MLRITAKVARSYGGRALMVGGALGLLLGCPLYEDGCDSRRDCASGFYCDTFSRRCEPVLEELGCRRPDQCFAGETCTPDFACRPGSCDFHGCITGYRCGVVDSAHTCVLEGADASVTDAGSAGMGGAPNDGGSGGTVTGPADSGATDAGLDAGAGDASADASLL